MRPKPVPSRTTVILLGVALAMIIVPSVWAAPKYKVVHAFGQGQDGAGTWGSLIFDQAGNLYGLTTGGGAYGWGTAFELAPQPSASWKETILYSFDRNGQDGYVSTANLTFDGWGNLFGTTAQGGAYDYGTVFELTPGSGGWIESVLHSFDVTDGARPYAGLVIDHDGNLYGTAGVVFELAPGAGGWTETVIDKFMRHNDGNSPFAGLVLGTGGNLYGTTAYGGGQNTGIVYQLKPASGGHWKERILHDFHSPKDGGHPSLGALAMDAAGNLYGATTGGGKNWCGSGSCGTVFKVAHGAHGQWEESVLYNFQNGTSGFGPGAGVVRDDTGNLYGTTVYGGDPQCGCGVVYKLSPRAGGKWKYSVLHVFTGYDGAQPDANLTLDNQGHIYGTAVTGGTYGYGVVFEITP